MSNAKRLRRVYTKDGLRPGETTLDAEASHYVTRVLRLNLKERLCLFDGEGREASATIEALRGGQVVCAVHDIETKPEGQLDLCVAVALPKGERADWMVEKLVETGVRHVVFIETERGTTTPSTGGQKFARFARIVAAAAAQSGRTTLPSLTGPLALREFLSQEFDIKVVAAFVNEGLPAGRLGAARTAALLVGPEGGFSDAEHSQIEGAGYRAARLGPFVMRVETAAVVGAASLIAVTSPPWLHAKS